MPDLILKNKHMTPQQKNFAISSHFNSNSIKEKHDWYGYDDRRYYKCYNCGLEKHWKEERESGPCAGSENNYEENLNDIQEVLGRLKEDELLSFYEKLSTFDSALLPHENILFTRPQDQSEILIKVIGKWKTPEDFKKEAEIEEARKRQEEIENKKIKQEELKLKKMQKLEEELRTLEALAAKHGRKIV